MSSESDMKLMNLAAYIMDSAYNNPSESGICLFVFMKCLESVIMISYLFPLIDLVPKVCFQSNKEKIREVEEESRPERCLIFLFLLVKYSKGIKS